MINTLVINVDELWLKGGNRPHYFKAINNHLKEVVALYHEENFTCLFENHRQVLHSETPFKEDLIEALLKVPGISSIVPARRVPLGLESIFPAIKEELLSYEKLPSTFRVSGKRSNKKFPLNSMEIASLMGGEILKKFPHLKVDVHTPEMTVWVKVFDNYIYISTKSKEGIGGLPVGMTGRLVTLISGGFDSPVASYLMSKRGCDQAFVFFYSYPFVGEEVKNKIFKLMEVLAGYQRSAKLYVVAFGHLQSALSKKIKEEYRTILFRYSMVMVSNLIAEKEKAEALLTGDSIGQVSSQTIGNIALLDHFSPRPILRPLVGYNKAEIIELSRKIKTHDISVIPHDDACALFAPKHPILRPDLSYVQEISSDSELQTLIRDTLEKAEVFSFNPKGQALKIS